MKFLDDKHLSLFFREYSDGFVDSGLAFLNRKNKLCVHYTTNQMGEYSYEFENISVEKLANTWHVKGAYQVFNLIGEKFNSDPSGLGKFLDENHIYYNYNVQFNGNEFEPGYLLYNTRHSR